MTFKTRTISYDTRVRAFWFMLFVLMVSIVVYMVAVRATIGNTVARANLESSTNALVTQVGNLEFQYISMEDNVSLQLAYSKGFENVTSPIYISRASSQSLSMNVPNR